MEEGERLGAFSVMLRELHEGVEGEETTRLERSLICKVLP